MQKIQKIEGKAIPLDRANVDTDQIIPAVWLRRVERTGFAEGLFSSWKQDPDFVMNKPEYEGGSILIAGPNFGIGSSREHAVWALMENGIQAVISPKFGDIFRNNATKTGLVPVVVPDEINDLLMRAATDEPGLEMSIDIENRMLSVPELGIEIEFPMDDFTQYRLLEGLDDIGITMRHADDITTYEATRPAWMPSIHL
ncbi:MAG: 3-isopropylmalate dehydratase small subunit [Thermomicrobiales bacterium]|nr:3-isopropylmalate dehydratase small subunit [Thermomicrobiales bacterium]